MRFCQECGASLSENVKYCPDCGKKIQSLELTREPNIHFSASADKTILKNVAVHLFKASPVWNINREDGDTIYVNYREDDKGASCMGSCLLILLFWPLAIVYSVLGGKKGKAGNILIQVKEKNIYISGDSRVALKAYKILTNQPSLEDKVVETETIKTAKRAKLIILGFIVIILIILIS